jgi:hypothetical protein
MPCFVEKERAVITLNSIGDAVLSTDISGKINYLNLVAEKAATISSSSKRNESQGR